MQNHPGTGGGGGGGRYPPPPPPPGRGGGGGGSVNGGGRNHGKGRSNRTRRDRIDLAMSNLRNALIEKGFNPNDAYNFARMALSQKGVQIGKGGKVHYKGDIYNAQQFVTNPLIQYVTGEKAKAANQAALLADPNYQMALQQLGLARDQSNATLDQQRTQALLDFGDPTFVQNNPQLAASVGANPFGTAQTLYHNQQASLQGLGQQANVLGVSGGLQSGQQQAQHVYAGQQFNATNALQSLLNNLTQQGQQIGQNYNLGQQNALLQTQQNLQQQGLLAAHGPKVMTKGFTFKLWNPRPPQAPRPPRPPRPPRNPGIGGALGSGGAY